MKAFIITAFIAIVTTVLVSAAMACDDDAVRDQNRLIQQQIRQQERQERIERDRNRMIDRAIRNDK